MPSKSLPSGGGHAPSTGRDHHSLAQSVVGRAFFGKETIFYYYGYGPGVGDEKHPKKQWGDVTFETEEQCGQKHRND